jgi:hypothetical protein
MNDSVRSWALSYAYLGASQLEFETVQDIEVVAEQLEEQYQTLLDSDVDKIVFDSVTDQRNDTVELFSQQKLTARRVTDVRTNLTTYRLLAYQYYGSSDDGEALAQLNESQVLAVEGDTEVLTP